MPLLDSAINSAASALGGKKDAAPVKRPKDKGTPHFREGDPIIEEKEDAKGHAAPQSLGSLDQRPIEWIHFGRRHHDVGANFTHPAVLEDLKYDDLPTGVIAHALMFRAALERETVLLHGFIASTAAVLKEYNDDKKGNKGGMGVSDLMGTTATVLGGKAKEGPPPPDPADLDPHSKDVSQAGGSINKTPIKYLDLHKAGVDLHQYRSDYTGPKSYTEFVEGYFLKEGGPSDDGPMTGMLNDLGPAIPGVGPVLQIAQGILFKAFNIYVAMYLNLRKLAETPIEDACYKLSVKAIKERHAAVFPAWFTKPPVPPQPENDAGATDGLIKPVDSAVKDVKDTVKDVEDKIAGFLGKDAEPAYGQEQFEQAFKAVETAGDAFMLAFKKILKVDSLPGFVQTLVTEMTTINVKMLHDIYGGFLVNRAPRIEPPVLLEIGRRALYNRIIELLGKLLPMLSFLQSDNKLASLGGIGGVSGKQVANKGLDLLDGAVADKVNLIVELAVKVLVDKMKAVQQDADTNKSLTMEIFLARLPYWLTLMVRNTLFPVWELVFEQLFGKLGALAGKAASPMQSMLGAAGEKADDVKDVNDKANRAIDKLGSGVNQNDILAAATDPSGFADKLLGGGPQKKKPEEEGAGGPAFPGSPRLDKGAGAEVAKKEADEVEKNQHVETTA